MGSLTTFHSGDKTTSVYSTSQSYSAGTSGAGPPVAIRRRTTSSKVPLHSLLRSLLRNALFTLSSTLRCPPFSFLSLSLPGHNVLNLHYALFGSDMSSVSRVDEHAVSNFDSAVVMPREETCRSSASVDLEETFSFTTNML